MKKLLLAVMAVALMGCSSGYESQNADVRYDRKSETIWVTDINVNGTDVTCVVFNAINEGGIDCDWEGYNNLRNGQL